MSRLIEDANKNKLLIATFKPTKINDCVWEKVHDKWDMQRDSSRCPECLAVTHRFETSQYFEKESTSLLI